MWSQPQTGAKTASVPAHSSGFVLHTPLAALQLLLAQNWPGEQPLSLLHVTGEDVPPAPAFEPPAAPVPARPPAPLTPPVPLMPPLPVPAEPLTPPAPLVPLAPA